MCGVWCGLLLTPLLPLRLSSFVFLPQVPDGVPNPGENCELAFSETNTLLNGTSTSSGGTSEQNTTDTVGLNLACQQPGLWGRAYTPGWEVPYYLVALVGVLFGLQVRVVPTHYSHVSFEIESDHFVNDVNRFFLSCTAVRVTQTSPRFTLSRFDSHVSHTFLFLSFNMPRSSCHFQKSFASRRKKRRKRRKEDL